MKEQERQALIALGRRLDHDFSRMDLLAEALTHSSAALRPGERTYQRLEFLGDRVLALVVAEMLLERFPAESEGHLARRLNELVRYETCAEIARALSLGQALILGAGEERHGGRDKPAILGDACEAVIGAIFLDAGFDKARHFVRHWWQGRLEQDVTPPRDAKTALQEWAQGKGLGSPNYRLVMRSGADHAPQFVIAVMVDGQGEAEGKGGSKRAAEHQAAETLLARLEGGEVS